MGRAEIAKVAVGGSGGLEALNEDKARAEALVASLEDELELKLAEMIAFEARLTEARVEVERLQAMTLEAAVADGATQDQGQGKAQHVVQEAMRPTDSAEVPEGGRAAASGARNAEVMHELKGWASEAAQHPFMHIRYDTPSDIEKQLDPTQPIPIWGMWNKQQQ